MKTQSAKNKGRTFQKFVREQILNKFPELTEYDVRSTSMGASGVDILFSKVALDLLPLSIECKHRKSLNLKEALKQAEENQEKGTVACVVHKGHRFKDEDVMITFRFSDFLDWYRSLINNEETKDRSMGYRDK